MKYTHQKSDLCSACKQTISRFTPTLATNVPREEWTKQNKEMKDWYACNQSVHAVTLDFTALLCQGQATEPKNKA